MNRRVLAGALLSVAGVVGLAAVAWYVGAIGALVVTLVGVAVGAGAVFVLPLVPVIGTKIAPQFWSLGLRCVPDSDLVPADDGGYELDTAEGNASRRKRCGKADIGVAWSPENGYADTSDEDWPFGDAAMADGGEGELASVELGHTLSGTVPPTSEGEELVIKDEIKRWAVDPGELIDRIRDQGLAEHSSGMSDKFYFTVVAAMAALSFMVGVLVTFVFPAL